MMTRAVREHRARVPVPFRYRFQRVQLRSGIPKRHVNERMRLAQPQEPARKMNRSPASGISSDGAD